MTVQLWKGRSNLTSTITMFSCTYAHWQQLGHSKSRKEASPLRSQEVSKSRSKMLSLHKSLILDLSSMLMFFLSFAVAVPKCQEIFQRSFYPYFLLRLELSFNSMGLFIASWFPIIFHRLFCLQYQYFFFNLWCMLGGSV